MQNNNTKGQVNEREYSEKISSDTVSKLRRITQSGRFTLKIIKLLKNRDVHLNQ